MKRKEDSQVCVRVCDVCGVCGVCNVCVCDVYVCA